jgi:hypothetical protein
VDEEPVRLDERQNDQDGDLVLLDRNQNVVDILMSESTGDPMKTTLAALWILVLVNVLPAQDDNQFVSAEYGFTLVPPRVEQSEGLPRQVAIFFLPAADGFSANVNVQVQPYADTMAAYDALSQGQFRQNKWKVLQSNVTEDSATYEYRGKYQTLQLHWYAVATKVGDSVILVTATGLDSAWAEQSEALRASVDSFQLNE